ncbi:MAG: DUF1554 domain-containing protein [Pseudomonadales bacterium]|nr:DUF1554 domain-containing protein [Pseudomonadales bacterium]
MKIPYIVSATALLAVSSLSLAQPPQQAPQDTSMSFFITSTNMGDGGNLGGLAGADAHCAALASAVGSTGKTWRAYLSTTGANGVNARDRIGSGPWFNVKGELIANNVADLHYSNTNLTKQKSLTEKGTVNNGVGDSPNQHDVLTGTNPDGTASNLNCNNWTSNAADVQATVGHADRVGGGPMASSWNASHVSRGCGAENLVASGGNGYFYCFAE